MLFTLLYVLIKKLKNMTDLSLIKVGTEVPWDMVQVSYNIILCIVKSKADFAWIKGF